MVLGAGTRQHGAAPSQPSIATRVVAGVHNSNSRPASVAAAERNERASGASPGVFARSFACSPEPGGPNTWRAAPGGRAAGPGTRSRCDPVGARREQGAPAARVTCPFVRQPAEHVCAWVGLGAVEAAATACRGRSAGLVAPVARVNSLFLWKEEVVPVV